MSDIIFCVICNRTVQVTEKKLLNTLVDGRDELRILSCGHTSKLAIRQIIEKSEFSPKVDEKITTTVSGAGIATVYGDLGKIDFQKVNQVPNIHIHLNNVINNKAFAINQNTIECSLDSIMTCINQMSLTQNQKLEVEGLVRDFEEETKKTKPESGKLKSIINRVIPIAIDLGLMLLKHGLEKGLITGPVLT